MLCGGTHNEKQAMMVTLKEIFDFDNTIGELSNMTELSYATRENRSSSWKING